jgi:hypothetical protein
MPISTAVLVALNLFMQVFDGIATYVGWQQFGEGNPLLRAGFETWGALPTLIVAKCLAMLLIVMVARMQRRMLVAGGLSLTFAAYLTMSFLPWSLNLLI